MPNLTNDSNSEYQTCKQNQNIFAVINDGKSINKSVKSAKIGAFSVKCLVDTGSDVNLISFNLFSELQIKSYDTVDTALIGLGSCEVFSIAAVVSRRQHRSQRTRAG